MILFASRARPHRIVARERRPTAHQGLRCSAVLGGGEPCP